jgi:hypothetical protein
VDDILEKIQDSGMDSLDNEEKSVLNTYSEWLKGGKKGDFMDLIRPKTDENEPKYDDFDDDDEVYQMKSTDQFTTILGDNSKFTFIYDYSEILNHENLHFGLVKWNNDEWYGLISTDKMGDLKEIDFASEKDGFQTYTKGEEGQGYDENKQKRLQDSLGNLLPETIYFFNEEVIPNLPD